jgi:hypothetical protein
LGNALQGWGGRGKYSFMLPQKKRSLLKARTDEKVYWVIDTAGEGATTENSGGNTAKVHDGLECFFDRGKQVFPLVSNFAPRFFTSPQRRPCLLTPFCWFSYPGLFNVALPSYFCSVQFLEHGSARRATEVAIEYVGSDNRTRPTCPISAADTRTRGTSTGPRCPAARSTAAAAQRQTAAPSVLIKTCLAGNVLGYDRTALCPNTK